MLLNIGNSFLKRPKSPEKTAPSAQEVVQEKESKWSFKKIGKMASNFGKRMLNVFSKNEKPIDDAPVDKTNDDEACNIPGVESDSEFRKILEKNGKISPIHTSGVVIGADVGKEEPTPKKGRTNPIVKALEMTGELPAQEETHLPLDKSDNNDSTSENGVNGNKVGGKIYQAAIMAGENLEESQKVSFNSDELRESREYDLFARIYKVFHSHRDSFSNSNGEPNQTSEEILGVACKEVREIVEQADSDLVLDNVRQHLEEKIHTTNTDEEDLINAIISVLNENKIDVEGIIETEFELPEENPLMLDNDISVHDLGNFVLGKIGDIDWHSLDEEQKDSYYKEVFDNIKESLRGFRVSDSERSKEIKNTIETFLNNTEHSLNTKDVQKTVFMIMSAMVPKKQLVEELYPPRIKPFFTDANKTELNVDNVGNFVLDEIGRIDWRTFDEGQKDSLFKEIFEQIVANLEGVRVFYLDQSAKEIKQSFENFFAKTEHGLDSKDIKKAVFMIMSSIVPKKQIVEELYPPKPQEIKEITPIDIDVREIGLNVHYIRSLGNYVLEEVGRLEWNTLSKDQKDLYLTKIFREIKVNLDYFSFSELNVAKSAKQFLEIFFAKKNEKFDINREDTSRIIFAIMSAMVPKETLKTMYA